MSQQLSIDFPRACPQNIFLGKDQKHKPSRQGPKGRTARLSNRSSSRPIQPPFGDECFASLASRGGRSKLAGSKPLSKMKPDEICQPLPRNLSCAAVACALLAASTMIAQAHPHHLVQAPNGVPAASLPSTNTGAVISGSGEFRYQFEPDRLKLPPEVRMKHGHGLCRDREGNIYFTFEPEEVESQTRALVRFAPDGTRAVLLGTNALLAQGVPHGLNVHMESDGAEVLYHANNNGTVLKTRLNGDPLWTQTWGPQMGNYKPTDAVVPPGDRNLVVADGYGSSMIHCLNTENGVYAGRSWVGAGPEHGHLNCPHGVTFDSRHQLLLIADRGNQRLEYFTTNGLYQSTVEVAEITAPCNVDIRGDYALVPDLNGPLVILDKDNRVISIIEVGKLLGERGFSHPHDAVWLENGDIVVCTWNPGRLGYWRKL
jgi:hypothetical protein